RLHAFQGSIQIVDFYRQIGCRCIGSALRHETDVDVHLLPRAVSSDHQDLQTEHILVEAFSGRRSLRFHIGDDSFDLHFQLPRRPSARRYFGRISASSDAPLRLMSTVLLMAPRSWETSPWRATSMPVITSPHPQVPLPWYHPCRLGGRHTLSSERIERRLTAILATDVAGYSRLMGADEEGTLAQLKAHRRALLDPKITEHRGRSVKTPRDGALGEVGR